MYKTGTRVAISRGRNDIMMTETNIDHNINDHNVVEDDIIETGPNDKDNDDLPQKPTGQKHRVDTGATTHVGAVAVMEPAPQLNRRFYRGLDRLSMRIRNARRREERRRRIQEAESDNTNADGDGDGPQEQNISQSVRRSSVIESINARVSAAFALSTGPEPPLIEATLVEDGTCIEAERVSYFALNWKRFALCFGFVLVILAVSLA